MNALRNNSRLRRAANAFVISAGVLSVLVGLSSVLAAHDNGAPSPIQPEADSTIGQQPLTNTGAAREPPPNTDSVDTGKQVKPAAPASASESRPLMPRGVSTATAEATRPAESPASALLSMAAPTLVVLGVIFVAAAIFRKVMGQGSGLAAALGAGGKAPSGLLEVLGRYPVARGQNLIVLKFDQRVLLLSHTSGGWKGRSSGSGFSTLCEITDADEVASILLKTQDAAGESIAAKFRTLMTQFQDGRQADADEGAEVPEGRLTIGSRGDDRAEVWDDRPHVLPMTRSAPRPPADPVAALKARLAAIAPGGREARDSEACA